MRSIGSRLAAGLRRTARFLIAGYAVAFSSLLCTLVMAHPGPVTVGVVDPIRIGAINASVSLTRSQCFKPTAH